MSMISSNLSPVPPPSNCVLVTPTGQQPVTLTGQQPVTPTGQQPMPNQLVPPPADNGEARKKPGRPRKRIPMLPVERHGIAPAPTVDENMMEFVYENPKIFKKIFTLYKTYVVGEVLFEFHKTHIKFITQDHTKKVHIFVDFDCSLLNHYFRGDNITNGVDEPIRVSVKAESLSRPFKNLDKVHSKITFVLKRDEYRNILHVVLRDCEMDDDQNYEIELIPQVKVGIMPEDFDDKNYPLKFSIPSKNFKKKITDIYNVSPVLTFQKRGESPLEFTYDVPKKVSLVSVYKNESKIKLVSKVDPNDILSTSIMLEQLKPFSNSNMGDLVTVCVDKYLPASFSTDLDPKKVPAGNIIVEKHVCSIKVFININKS